MKRQMLTLEGWDNTTVKIPLPKNGYWWSYSHGKRCVVGCKNNPNTIYLSDFGLAHLAYCEVHAESRILFNLIRGELQRGVWIQCRKGKMEPVYGGYNMIDNLIASTKDKKILNNLLILKARLQKFRKEQKK